MKSYYVYIMASQRYGTLYVGVTNDLIRRVHEHRTDAVKGFTEKYHVHRLVYHEQTEDILSALAREKQIKKWERKWKIELIEAENPGWEDLYAGLVDPHSRNAPRTSHGSPSAGADEKTLSRG
jgi:putative endonuclease